MMHDTRKAHLDKLTDLFLNDMESLRHDAGWHQDSMIGLFIEFGGQPPPPTGNDKSNAKMLHEIWFLRGREHALLNLSKTALKRLCHTSPGEFLAVLSSRYYVHNYLDPKTRTVKVYKDTDRARLVGQTPKQYRANLERGYAKLDEIVDILELGIMLSAA